MCRSCTDEQIKIPFNFKNLQSYASILVKDLNFKNFSKNVGRLAAPQSILVHGHFFGLCWVWSYDSSYSSLYLGVRFSVPQHHNTLSFGGWLSQLIILSTVSYHNYLTNILVYQ